MYFAAVATTEMMLGEGEQYFAITFDDGIRVWLDNDIVFENWGSNSPTKQRITLGHKPGRHNIKVEFFQASGGYALDVDTDIDHFHAAKRQANAAVALLRMGQPSRVWQMLQHSSDPTVRSYLIHRLGSLGADAKAIAQQLDKESDVTIRRPT